MSGGEGGVILMSYSCPLVIFYSFHVIALLVTLVSFEDHASVISCPCFSVSGDENMAFLKNQDFKAWLQYVVMY